ncbi:ABC transporter permease [Chelativorans sp. AA-79]|uniref:ABC transporter permease n=1 Tax=Chelativorans sp. AA-79 TaxID=3028735 RepID=UPI0023F9B8AE|nr:ABC transporter permease [Chelativorans sp. AA-79]WEX11011.1 ABC transporter permease [Chelativorans sp. AA-79]
MTQSSSVVPARRPPITDTPSRRAMLRKVKRRPSIRGSMIALLVIVAIGFLLPYLAPQNPYDLTAFSVMDNRLPPGSESFDGTVFLLGTDQQGRDMVSAIFYGMRVSLMVGLISTAIALVIGICVGLVAAVLGGRIEALLMRLVDFILGFPTILVALVLLAMMGRGVDKVIIAIVMVQWANYARIMRSAALSEREKEYVEAAFSLGYTKARVMFRHIMPNSLNAVLVVATVQIASAITLEATLSFLGVGVPVTEPSLGLLVASGFDYLMSGDYWISFYPGVALVILIFSLNLVGDRLRTALDPKRS